MQKAFYGFAKYETTPHEINLPVDRPCILVFSKTTAYRHKKAIGAANALIQQLASNHGWFIYQTEDAGIFNAAQIAQFDLLIWNNSTGTVLTDEQRINFQEYILNGGGFVGIHGSGDKSHQWPWYVENIIGAEYSHHPIKNHIQESEVFLEPELDSIWNLHKSWTLNEEWYIFKSSPSEKGFTITHAIDGTSIDPNGNILWLRDFDFGMGREHPVAWHKEVGKGRSFYTSLGHLPETYEKQEFTTLLEQAIKWAAQLK